LKSIKGSPPDLVDLLGFIKEQLVMALCQPEESLIIKSLPPKVFGGNSPIIETSAKDGDT